MSEQIAIRGHTTCAARAGNAGPNAQKDCDWPFCGCDSHADKVIAALEESGWRAPDRNEQTLGFSWTKGDPGKYVQTLIPTGMWKALRLRADRDGHIISRAVSVAISKYLRETGNAD